MSEPRPSAKNLTRAVGAAHTDATGAVSDPDAPMRRLATVLGRLIGSTGFDVILARSVTLSAREDATLASVTASDGGRLEGLPEPPAERARCTLLVLSHLLELLMKLIGEDLATRVVRDAWPLANDGETRETKR